MKLRKDRAGVNASRVACRDRDWQGAADSRKDVISLHGIGLDPTFDGTAANNSGADYHSLNCKLITHCFSYPQMSIYQERVP